MTPNKTAPVSLLRPWKGRMKPMDKKALEVWARLEKKEDPGEAHATHCLSSQLSKPCAVIVSTDMNAQMANSHFKLRVSRESWWR